ncbi:MAG: VOC family protein [Methylophilaceae bacterium]
MTINTIPTITPYLNIKGAEAAIAFYEKAFGANENIRIMMGGNVGHAEIQIGEAKMMLAEEIPAWGNKSPMTLGGSSVTIALQVHDVDATFKRALGAGATTLMVVKDMFYGDRAGVLVDPFGHHWHISTHIEDVSLEEMQKRSDAMFVEHQK